MPDAATCDGKPRRPCLPPARHAARRRRSVIFHTSDTRLAHSFILAQAHKAFTLAIEGAAPTDEKHIYYSNRSLCSLSLNKPDEAEADARKVRLALPLVPSAICPVGMLEAEGRSPGRAGGAGLTTSRKRLLPRSPNTPSRLSLTTRYSFSPFR